MSKIVLRCSNVFWGIFFRKKIPQCSMEVRVFEKIQKSKKAQNRSQKYSNVFWTCLGWFFWKSFFAQCSMEGRAFENFQKNQKNFKIQKMPLIVSKIVHTCFEHALGRFFRIFFTECSMQGFSDFLDLKMWVQFCGLKNKSLAFRT